MQKSKFVKDFGECVRDYRYERGLSQEDLADLAGLHRTAISFIEQGKRSSTLETIEKLAKALAVQPAELMPHLNLSQRRKR